MSRSPQPYGWSQIALSYIRYWFRSKNRHGVHPPRIYDFVTEVIRKRRTCADRSIEAERKRLLDNHSVFQFTDHGKDGAAVQRQVSEIARRSVKHPKYAQLIARMCEFYSCDSVLELGTSLGITTAYIAQHAKHVTTMEGDETVLGLAQQVWESLNISNIDTISGDFDDTLYRMGLKKFDLIYIDGNHRYEPTVRYFEHLLTYHATHGTIFIFDDIHYSEQMEDAWKHIQDHPAVTTSADLFFIGVVWIDPKLSNQHFELRF